jgi:uncharacterized membrane protein YdbT with pleckstrin-like domain
MTTPPLASDATVWSGAPSARAELPSYLALLLGGIAATAAFVFLGDADQAGRSGRSLGALVPWLVTATWLVCAGAAAAILVQSRSKRYELTTQRLRVTTGLLSTTTQEIELRRVRDTVVVQPFFLRMMGLGHVTLLSADSSTPRVTLDAVPDPTRLQSTIRELVQEAYRRGAVREFDIS